MPGAPEAAEEPPGIFARDLVGAWHLAAYTELDEDGDWGEGPLGPHPRGVLIYEPRGCMSVSMMPGHALEAPGPGDASQPSATGFMGYAGTWRIAGRRVVHHVEVSSHAYQVGRELIRHARLDDGRLLLTGTAVLGGRPRHRMLVWQRGRPTAAGTPALAASERGSGS